MAADPKRLAALSSINEKLRISLTPSLADPKYVHWSLVIRVKFIIGPIPHVLDILYR